MFGQKKTFPAHTIWLTGLSGAGKSTIADQLSEKYMILDGDAIRKGLCSDLGFTDEDRKENMRRLTELCKLLNKNDINVVTAFISPFEDERAAARNQIENCYIVYCKSSLETCERRDVKGLYKKARSGEIPHFTGIGSKYEVPVMVDFILDTQNSSPHDSLTQLKGFIAETLLR